MAELEPVDLATHQDPRLLRRRRARPSRRGAIGRAPPSGFPSPSDAVISLTTARPHPPRPPQAFSTGDFRHERYPARESDLRVRRPAGGRSRPARNAAWAVPAFDAPFHFFLFLSSDPQPQGNPDDPGGGLPIAGMADGVPSALFP